MTDLSAFSFDIVLRAPGGNPVADLSAFPFRVVLRPDRRQVFDRRQDRRGGRRASDPTGFAVSSAIAAHEELAQTGSDAGPSPAAKQYRQ